MGSGQRGRRTTTQPTTPRRVPGYEGGVSTRPNGQAVSSVPATSTPSARVPKYATGVDVRYKPQPPTMRDVLPQMNTDVQGRFVQGATEGGKRVLDWLNSEANVGLRGALGLQEPGTYYTGPNVAPNWKGSIPKFFPDGLTGRVAKRDVSQPEAWRDVLGLPQGVTYQTNALNAYRAGYSQPIGGNTTTKLTPYQPNVNLRGDNSREDKAAVARERAFTSPYGSVYYSAPQGRDWLNYSPPVSASGWFDDTLKYRGTGTTTDLYNPKTLQGRPKPLDFTITPNAQATSTPWAALPTGQMQTGGGGGGGGGGYPPRGGGGGGGGGGYNQQAAPWWYGLVNWRL